MSQKFLGITIDNDLQFDEHIQQTRSKAKKHLHALTKLKRLGVNQAKLCLFYNANVRSVLCYASPAFYTLLSVKQKQSLKSVRRYAMRIILPHIDPYTSTLEVLDLSTLENFITKLTANRFSKIVTNSNHNLHGFLPKRQSSNRHSKRLNNNFIRPLIRTSLRAKSFFISNL